MSQGTPRVAPGPSPHPRPPAPSTDDARGARLRAPERQSCLRGTVVSRARTERAGGARAPDRVRAIARYRAVHRKTGTPEKRVFHAEFVKNGFSGVFHGFAWIFTPVKNCWFSRAFFTGRQCRGGRGRTPGHGAGRWPDVGPGTYDGFGPPGAPLEPPRGPGPRPHTESARKETTVQLTTCRVSSGFLQNSGGGSTSRAPSGRGGE